MRPATLARTATSNVSKFNWAFAYTLNVVGVAVAIAIPHASLIARIGIGLAALGASIAFASVLVALELARISLDLARIQLETAEVSIRLMADIADEDRQHQQRVEALLNRVADATEARPRGFFRRHA